MGSSNSLSDNFSSAALCLAVAGCGLTDYQVGQASPADGSVGSVGSSNATQGGTKSSNAIDARSGGGKGGSAFGDSLESGLATLGGSVAERDKQTFAGLGNGGSYAAISSILT
ncbi:MAG TPA: hypothetical protein VIV60_24135, partial [Polyangiaceae bacterium]